MPPLTSPDEVPRRHALRLMAAAAALSGLGGCDEQNAGGKLIPAVVTPPGIVPGLPGHYATASVHAGYGSGVVVTHQTGRPIKVEGNPLHPSSLGATSAVAQAEILNFYDPAREFAITRAGAPGDARGLLTALGEIRAQAARVHGEGLRILTGSVTSPTFIAQMGSISRALPEARWHQWDAIPRAAVLQGGVRAYGRAVEVLPKLEQADVLLGIDSDLIETAPGAVRFARDVASRRNPTRTRRMSRLYVMEPTPTLLGSIADHRAALSPRDMRAHVGLLANAILHGGNADSAPGWLRAAIVDLKDARGRAFVHAGPTQPAEVHALVHVVNEALGGRGAAYELIEPVVPEAASLRDLVTDMHAGRVTALIIVDVNPVFAAPVELDFTAALSKVPFNLALTTAPDETSARTLWSVPQVHAFEGWSDVAAHDGTATIMQPQSLPLYDGISAHTLVELLTEEQPAPPLVLVQRLWRKRLSGDFSAAWRQTLADGVVPGTKSPVADVPLRADAARVEMPLPPAHPLALDVRPDPYLWDGRHANNPWLQELPRPLTKLVWNNPLLIAPALALRSGLANGDRVELSLGARKVVVPVWVVHGQASDVVTASLGFGREIGGDIARGVGWNAFPVAGLKQPPRLRKIGKRDELACTDRGDPFAPTGQDAARQGDIAAFLSDPNFLADRKPAPRLYARRPPGPAEWAMSIDLNACVGCNACVVACMAENNVPTVGAAEVMRQREMHWLRIDRYYAGDGENPRTVFQPMLCQHCEQAPCETVCPVGATVHDSEGLNVMVYNRCIGTRFCSNNCPYKVRRFNYFAYSHEEQRSIAARNPNVSVRGRGVMEKCTFCLQRIAEARIAADREDRAVGAQEVRTACQAACPTQAFTFSNIAAPGSDVAQRHESPLIYTVLPDQQTSPRVTYEARIRNPNPSFARE
jgi:molybdopterin-containing oxidoreductase family iron-sulfur binding subunit